MFLTEEQMTICLETLSSLLNSVNVRFLTKTQLKLISIKFLAEIEKTLWSPISEAKTDGTEYLLLLSNNKATVGKYGISKLDPFQPSWHCSINDIKITPVKFRVLSTIGISKNERH